MSGTSVEILLATYQGGPYLREMLESLLDQDRQDFRLRVRDDGSTDGTPALLAEFRERFGDRMTVSADSGRTGSAKGNFARLMTEAEADHILFADQDDVWSRDHVSVITALLSRAESAHSAEAPIFAFTDATPVDAALRPLRSSYFGFKRIDPGIVERLSQCLVCAPMLGCAAGINRALLRLATPVPVDDVTGHDWWALLLAVAAGRAVWTRQSTVLYRVHGSNSSAPSAVDPRAYAKASGKRSKVRRGMALRRLQAEAVRTRLGDAGPAAALAVIERFRATLDRPAIGRRVGLVRGNYLYPDRLRTAAMLALC